MRLSEIGSRIADYEQGLLTYEETLSLFDDLIRTGLINHLQGMYQRLAYDLVRSGELASYGHLNADCEVVS